MGADMAQEQPTFLTPAQVVARWNDAVTTGTLANWRSKGAGPTFQKFGSRVRYPLAALEKWETTNTKLSFEAIMMAGLSGGNDNKDGGKTAAA